METQTLPTSKVTTAVLTLAGIVGGLTGGMTLNAQEVADLNTQLDVVETEVQAVRAEKQHAVDIYVYDMVRTGLLPDPGVANTANISQAYVNVLKANGINLTIEDVNNGDVTPLIVNAAQSKGELLQCK